MREYKLVFVLLLIGFAALQAYALYANLTYSVWLFIPLLATAALLAHSLKGAYSGPSAVFQWTLIAYFVLLIADEFIFVPFSLSYLSFVVIALGLLAVFLPAKKEKTTVYKPAIVWLLGAASALLVFLATPQLEALRYVASLLAGAFVVALNYTNDDREVAPLHMSATTLLLALSSLFALAAVLTFWLGLSSFRIVFASVFVLFAPGFMLSYVFARDDIDMLQRMGISLALSLAVLPLLVFYLSSVGMSVSLLSVAAVSLFITSAAYIIYKRTEVRYVPRRRRNNTR